jgi:GNAT superfamily N-acetyltransferase
MRQRPGHHPDVRRAVEYDLVELIRLRALPFEYVGEGPAGSVPQDEEWLDALAVVLKDQLTADDVRVLVVDGDATGDGGRLAACGIATIEQRLPGPRRRNGLVGHVLGVVTDPVHRGRGHDRVIVRELLDWCREREVARVDLDVSAECEPLYRELGFTGRPGLALSRRA